MIEYENESINWEKAIRSEKEKEGREVLGSTMQLSYLKGTILRLEDTFSFFKGNYLMSIVSAVFTVSFQSIFWPFSSIYVLDLGGSYEVVGLISGAYMLVNTIVQVPGGYVADHYGRRKMLVCGCFLTSLGWMFRAIAPDWRWYVLAELCFAGFLFYLPAENAMLMDSLPPEKRGIGLATLSTITTLCGLTGPYIGGYVHETLGVLGLRMACFLGTISDFIIAVIWFRYMSESLQRTGIEDLPKGLWQFIRESLKATLEAFRWMPRPLVGLAAINVIAAFSGSAVGPFYSVYALYAIGLLSKDWGLISSVQTGVSLPLGILGGKVVDKFSRKKLMLLAWIVTAPYSLAFVTCRSMPQVLILFVYATIVGAITWPASSRLQGDLTPRTKRGMVGAVFRILSTGTGTIGSMIGGYIYGLDSRYPFWMDAALSVVSIPLIMLLVQDPERPEE